jgi:hypothetical protein
MADSKYETSTPHNYRICFDFAAESPREAVAHLLGIVLDPQSQDIPFNWLVIDTATNQEHWIRCTFNELEKEAREHVTAVLKGLAGGQDTTA